MNRAVRAQVRARATSKIDLKAITPEQAIYAVLDRALLWSVLENSWWRTVLKGVCYVVFPLSVLSGSLWLLHAPWQAVITPLVLGTAVIFGLWLIDMMALAHEGREARIVASMSRAVRDPTENPPPVDPSQHRSTQELSDITRELRRVP